MSGITASLISYEIDEKALEAAFKEAIAEVYRGAARAFLEAAIPKIPVRTGFLAGAFRILADAAGATYSINAIERLLRKHEAAKVRQRAAVKRLNEEIKAHAAKEEQLGKLEEATRKLQGEHERLAQAPASKERDSSIYNIRRELNKLRNLRKYGPGQLERAARSIELLQSRVEKLRIRTEELKEKVKGQGAEAYRYEGPRYKTFTSQVKAKRNLERFRLRSLQIGHEGPFELYKHTDGTYTIKTPTSGVRFAHLSKFPPANHRGLYEFEFRVDIIYLSINDEKYGWNSWEAGSKAFAKYMQANLKDLVDISHFLSVVRYTLVGGSITKTKEKLVR